MEHPGRLAIVTQDPANYGGVLRLVEYIYRRGESIGLAPVLLHYGSFAHHPELHSSLTGLVRGELNFVPRSKDYIFRGMRARAIGARFPEWEPQRIRSNALWRRALSEFDSFMLVTGSAHTGLALAESGKYFAAWVSSTVEEDRRARLSHASTPSAIIERLGLPAIHRAEHRVLDNASRILAVSNATRDHLSEVSARPSEVWPFPIDTVKFSPAPARDSDVRFLFVGRANDPRKRIELFLSACEALKQTNPNLDFSATIVSSKISLPHDFPFPIEWVTSASDDMLIDLYRNATALVLTSEQEGLGIAAMEAMACGLPVISTRCGGPETFIEDGVNGIFVDNDAHAIAHRMFELATEPSKRQTMGAAARERIESTFSETIWNPKFDQLFQNV